jgi:inosine-uridine nucleoside N-ribohydrolase
MLKLHLDTDIAGDIDDLCALAMVLNWPDVELLAVTTVSDDQGRRAGYAQYALDLAGRGDVAVAAGADVSLDYYRGRPGFPDEKAYWPEPIPPAPTSLDQALSLLEKSIEKDAVIAAIGPFTNLALLEKRSPGILRSARLYLMGGYVFPPGEGFPRWDHTADYNVQIDVASAQYVFERSNPTLVPFSVTVQTSLRRSHLSALKQAGPLAQLIGRQAEAFARDEDFEAKYGQTCAGLHDDLINFQHDPLACAIASGWDQGVEINEFPLQSEIRDGWLWQSIVDDGKLTRVVTRADGDKFSEFWLDLVTKAR